MNDIGFLPPPTARRLVLRRHGLYSAQPAPYASLQSKPCLLEDHYAELADSFPRLDQFAAGAEALDNRVLRIASSRVIQEPGFSGAWRWFVQQHTSQAFWEQIVREFGGQIQARYPELEQRFGKPMQDWRAVRRGSGEVGEVTLECQIVVNTPVRTASSVKAPHVDHVRKLWTGLLYFRSPEDDTPGGELQLFSSPPGLRFDAHQASRREVVLDRSLAYAPNSFIGFVNGPEAIHAVAPRPQTPQVRRYVDFVVELAEPVFKLPQMNPLRRGWYRLRERQASR
jgi:hypothetical protein